MRPWMEYQCSSPSLCMAEAYERTTRLSMASSTALDSRAVAEALSIEVSTRDQISEAAAELHRLIDRLEQEALGALDQPSMERLAAFDTHRHVIDSTLTILRRTVMRRVEREQSKTEPNDDDTSETGPHQQISKRPTTRPR